MSIDQKIEGDVGKLFLSDEIDLDKSPEVRENIKQLFDQVKTVEVQLSKVTYIDSSGIAALIEGMQLGKSNSKEFYLTDVSNEVMKVIINQVGCFGINIGKIDFYLSNKIISEKSNSIKI